MSGKRGKDGSRRRTSTTQQEVADLVRQWNLPEDCSHVFVDRKDDGLFEALRLAAIAAGVEPAGTTEPPPDEADNELEQQSGP